jgi:YHS domain-containing protein
MARDPVCGMDVDEGQAAATSEYMGTTYYFCSKGCKKAFDANPQQYAQNADADSSGMEHSSHPHS